MKKHYKLYITLFIIMLSFITTLISVGFSALNQSLNISGDVDYEINSPTLYNVLKKEAQLGTYATEYTGDHQDSMDTSLSTQKIYHWKTTNITNANVILDKWNVIFGGFCWQMIRTTDTGGVKLIYNGTPTDGKCNNSGTAQQIGTSAFNTNSSSPADVGYMYNKRYTYNSKKPSSLDVLTRTSMTKSSNYYYGTGVTYSSGTYTLTGTTQDTWTNTYSSSSGLYTCKSATATTCSTVYYIAGGESSYMYGFSMTEGNLLNYYNTNITLGTGYSESNGIYSLTNTTTISKADWFSNYSTYKNYYTCGDNNTTCTNLKYITATYNYYYYSILVSNNYIYANNFTYDSGINKYTLSSDRYKTWNMTDTDKTNLATHHYTCFNDTGVCETLSYVYYASTPSGSSYIFYINLTGGKSIEDAIDEMLYNDNVNQTNSTIKTYIDNWYSSNMTSYTSYLEDTIFCNERSQINQQANGWNPNGGSLSTYMYFKNYITNSDLSCTSDTDKFSLSNNKAKLTYPVGLLTYPETNLLNNSNLRKTGQAYWFASPYSFDYRDANEHIILSSGSYSNDSVYYINGVRPAVSLTPGIEYIGGTGSKSDPYIVN